MTTAPRPSTSPTGTGASASGAPRASSRTGPLKPHSDAAARCSQPDESLRERVATQLESPAGTPDAQAVYEDSRALLALLDELVRLREPRTQQVVAQLMGTTESTVRDLEGGLTDPHLSTLQRYARALGRRVVITIE